MSWYKEFYLVTPVGEKDLKAALADPQSGAAARADVERRLTEMREIDPARCAISAEQIAFLERVLNG